MPHDGGQKLVFPAGLKHLAEEALNLRGVVAIGLGAHGEAFLKGIDRLVAGIFQIKGVMHGQRGPQDTSSAPAGRSRLWEGPERAKRAEFLQRLAA